VSNQLWEAEERSGHVIAEPCVDIVDRSVVEQCPVDGVYQAARWLYSHPDECVDCRVWEPECPTEGSSRRRTYRPRVRNSPPNARFLGETLPGSGRSLGRPPRRATGDPTFMTGQPHRLEVAGQPIGRWEQW
jgi:NAD-dependent dihydropyrimidine dehydrogenase PreA subunit